MIEQHNALTPAIDWETLEKVVVQGDIGNLSSAERLSYYRAVCTSVGLNPATQPFAYIRLNNKLTLYARKDATDQLRRLYRVSIGRLEKERDGDLFTVTAYATMPDGREDADMGAVNVKGLSGEALANAYLKAITKAKRRVTLSICGLGMLDETEVDSIPDAIHVDVSAPGNDAPAAIESTPATLTPDQERDCRAYVRKHGYSGDDMRWWMAHHDMSLWSEMTVDDARAMMADAKAGRRPWQPAPPASDEPPISTTGELIGDDFDAEEAGL